MRLVVLALLASVWLIPLALVYRSGKRRAAALGVLVLVSFFVFIAIDERQKTGLTTDAVAIECKPRGYKTSASCVFEGADGISRSLPTSDRVKPGTHVLLVQTRGRLTRGTQWHVVEREK